MTAPDRCRSGYTRSDPEQLDAGRNRAKVRAKDPNALTESELAELKRLRKENADLKTDREILYKAAAFFARETDR